jgi:hypothetical protein
LVRTLAWAVYGVIAALAIIGLATVLFALVVRSDLTRNDSE